mmetsp:Transcript_48330/g.121737  ORF Transcript_48330/g.121737 Transcript_48330/m.121737 type:complete len:269 (-) Transcript_48330:327-1133(-)
MGSALVEGVPTLIIFERVEQTVVVLSVQVVHTNLLPSELIAYNVEVVLLPLLCQLVPHDEARVLPQEGSRIPSEVYRVQQVQQQEETDEESPHLEEVRNHEDKVNNGIRNSNRHKTNQHHHVGAVVAKAYAIGHPTAVLVESQHRPLVEPMLVSTQRQRCLTGLPLSEELLFHHARICQRSVQGAAYRPGVDRQEEHVAACGAAAELRHDLGLEPRHAHGPQQREQQYRREERPLVDPEYGGMIEFFGLYRSSGRRLWTALRAFINCL